MIDVDDDALSNDILNGFTEHDEILLQMSIPKNYRQKGWIYILENPSMPEIYKVGMTTIHPNERAKELSRATGVPTPFKVTASFLSENPREDEKRAHEYLAEYRVNNFREFFKCPLSEIYHLCREAGGVDAAQDVAELASYYDLITFEEMKKLNLDDLINDLNITCFGNTLALAERLIRIGADTIKKRKKEEKVSFVFNESVMYSVKNFDEQWQEECEKQRIAEGRPLIKGGF